jgi:hypothetical protein
MLSRRELLLSGALAPSLRPAAEKVTRAGDGRAEMEVTTVVLRSDIADTQIGVPYDR